MLNCNWIPAGRRAAITASAPEFLLDTLSLTLFGPMQALVNGHPLPRMRSRKGLWLLALLTLRHGRPVEREWLAGTLWPDVDQSQAFANLRPILSELRRSLDTHSERLQSPNRHTLLLDLTGAEADILVFDAAIVGEDLAGLEKAVRLYRGPLLEGCSEEWVFQERNVREQDCLRALEQLADAALATGDYARAGGFYQRAVHLAPWLDAARRGWMEALAGSGDRNAALQVYREFVEFLRGDPNASPDEQTTALYARLRVQAREQGRPQVAAADRPMSAPPVSGSLPHPLTQLIGRETEVQEVASCLRRSRLVTLTGLGGIGKTRLALAAARAVADTYPDGVWLVALEAIPTGDRVEQQTASSLGIREERGRPLLDSLTDALRRKRLLLVLDNCEHVLDACARLAGHLMRKCEGLQALATSREPLGITGETTWAVPSLSFPDRSRLPVAAAALLDSVAQYESVQLFIERAQAAQKTFALAGSNAHAVAEVCARLEGMPLALELAAARVKVMTVEQIAARLTREIDLLSGGNRVALTRQQTLRATLNWSYDLLTEEERLLFARLSVFAGGWTLDAAEQVCAGDPGEVRQILDRLTSLVDKSLVVYAEQEDGRCFRLLEMVRQYAAEKLRSSGAAGTLCRRHRDYYLRLAEAAAPHLHGVEQGAWLTRLETEHDNLRGALAWRGSEIEDVQAGLRLAGMLWRFWEMRGHYSEGRTYLADALQRDGAEPRNEDRARVLNGAGLLAYYQGDTETARRFHEESLAISRELGDRRGCAWPLNHLGVMAARQGNYRAARARFEEGLTLWRELQDAWGVGWSLHQLGGVARELGHFSDARTMYEECLAISQKLGDRHGIAWAFNDLGEVAYHQENYAAACLFYEDSLTISRELKDKQGIAWSLHHLANSLSEQSEYAQAMVLREESVALFRELGNRQGLAWALRQQGYLAEVQGDHDTARRCYEESLLLQRQLQNKVGTAWALHSLGRVNYVRGDLVSAQSLYRESLLLHSELEKSKGIAACLDGLAEVALEQGEARRAALLWGAAETARESSGISIAPDARKAQEAKVRQARLLLGEAFQEAWHEGYTHSRQEAVRLALRDRPVT